ncbi:glycosyltransferase 87 family protein [Nocardia sp. IBHARD005]|uniref:glycosyltransferase 87 family protein n=1 Tax=Nocardia sp. IBHARD005 TaxID=3457765 RepID=UPI00405A075F
MTGSSTEPGRLRTSAPWVALAGSIAAMVVFLQITAVEYYLGDLRVFVSAPGWLADGTLYDAASRTGDGSVMLPFLYPPWVAAAFTPLTWLPFPVVAVGWTVLGIAALLGSVLLSLSLVTGQRHLGAVGLWRSAAWWSAGLLWIAPVRHCLYEGQLALLLLLAVLIGGWSARSVAGAAIGLAAAAKIVPFAALLGPVLAGRYRTVGWGLAGVAVPLAVGWMAFPAMSRRFLLEGSGLDAVERVGGVGTVANQSLRAALSRFIGADIGWQWPWWLGAAVLTALAVTVLVRRPGDRAVALWVPTVLAAALFPLGWTHQWVWLIPLLIWLRRGPARRTRWARTLSGLWLFGSVAPMIELLLFVQQSNYIYGRPLWQALFGAAYVLGTAVTFGCAARASTAQPTPAETTETETTACH